MYVWMFCQKSHNILNKSEIHVAKIYFFNQINDYDHFWTIALGKGMNPLSSQQWVK